MSMLAGPRRKQKVINLRAKNSDWSNDNSKFGQRMLEKMGWSEGKGLGLKENGIVEHVIAKYKNDDKGLGYQDRNDQWTKHEDDFNSLLANLSNGDVNKDKLHSGISLEDKSKKSKARVHYHKYTRGKDLTRYSEKDLANIFGKKSLKNEENREQSLKEDLKTVEQVFTEKGSMEDYFKNKMAKIKSKNNTQSSNNENEDEADYMFNGFSGAKMPESEKSETHQGFGFNSFSSHDNLTDHVIGNKTPLVIDNGKIKKKHKKIKFNEGSESIENGEPFSYCDSLKSECHNETDSIYNCDNNKKRKKKKMKDQELCTIENTDIQNNLLNTNDSSTFGNSNIEEIRIKKGKKSKCKMQIQNEHKQNIETNESENMKTSFDINEHPAHKNKKIKKRCKQEEGTSNILEKKDDSYIPKKKKKRKNKEVQE